MIYLAAFLFLCYVGYKVLASIYGALDREAAIDAEVAVELQQYAFERAREEREADREIAQSELEVDRERRRQAREEAREAREVATTAAWIAAHPEDS